MGSRVSFHFKKPEPSVCSNASHLLVSLKTVGSPGSVLPFHPQPLKCIKKTFLVSTEEVRRAFLYGSEYLGTEMTQGQSLGLALDWGPLCPMQGVGAGVGAGTASPRWAHLSLAQPSGLCVSL